MAGKKREEVEERDITGLTCFQDLLPLFERLHEVGCERDTSGNRELYLDECCVLILLFLSCTKRSKSRSPRLHHRKSRSCSPRSATC